jgi:2-phosphosulfolactate phosphatase
VTFDQSEFNIRCEWGERGAVRLAPISDAIIIVDVMSFSTCVSIATGRGASVFPCRYEDESKHEFAESVSAEIAGPRGKNRYSLSPVSLMDIPEKTRLVLPSPNGSALTLSTGTTPTYAGCLRNSKAVAIAAMRHGTNVSVIPAGERWKEDGSLRPALEDLIGTGAIIRHLVGSLSPEAQAALSVYKVFKGDILETLKRCVSGVELIEMGFEDDIPLIAELDVDNVAPFLNKGAYVRTEQDAGVSAKQSGDRIIQNENLRKETTPPGR